MHSLCFKMLCLTEDRLPCSSSIICYKEQTCVDNFFYEKYENICFTKAETFIFGKGQTIDNNCHLSSVCAIFFLHGQSNPEDQVQAAKYARGGDAATWQTHQICTSGGSWTPKRWGPDVTKN